MLLSKDELYPKFDRVWLERGFLDEVIKRQSLKFLRPGDIFYLKKGKLYPKIASAIVIVSNDVKDISPLAQNIPEFFKSSLASALELNEELGNIFQIDVTPLKVCVNKEWIKYSGGKIEVILKDIHLDKIENIKGLFRIKNMRFYSWY